MAYIVSYYCGCDYLLSCCMDRRF